MENTNKYTGLPYPQTFTGMYILLDPTNGNVECISSSPMSTPNEIWVSKEEYGEDYMWLSNMRRVDGQWVEKPKMKQIWRISDGSSGEIEVSEDTPEGFTDVEVSQGMRKPVFYKGEWVEEDTKKILEENELLKTKLDKTTSDTDIIGMSVIMMLNERYEDEEEESGLLSSRKSTNIPDVYISLYGNFIIENKISIDFVPRSIKSLVEKYIKERV